MTTLFISYSRANKSRVSPLVQELQALGFTVWIDVSGIRGGTTWSSEIARAIKECDYFLLLMSSESVASDNVRREVDLAFNNKKPIIPMRLEQVGFPQAWEYQVAGIQWIEYDKDWKSRLLGALGDAGVAPGKIGQPSGKLHTNREISVQWRWAAMIIPAVVILALMLIYFKGYMQSPSPTIVPVPTHTFVAVTSAVTSTASPIATPISMTATPTFRAAFVMFEDTFNDNRNKWLIEPGKLSIADGKFIYTLSCPRSYGYPTCGKYPPIPSFTFPRNFRMEIDATVVDLSPGGQVSIGFQMRRNEDDFYYVNYFIDNGFYELKGTYRHNDLVIISHTATDLMKKDPGATNRIGIELKNTVITPILNGQRLSEGEDDYLPDAGDSYLTIFISKGDSATIEFDNLTVEEVK